MVKILVLVSDSFAFAKEIVEQHWHSKFWSNSSKTSQKNKIWISKIDCYFVTLNYFLTQIKSVWRSNPYQPFAAQEYYWMLLQIHEKVNVILLHLFSIPSNKNLISFLSCRLHPDYFWIYANLILELKFPTCLFPNSSFILVFSILHERTLK